MAVNQRSPLVCEGKDLWRFIQKRAYRKISLQALFYLVRPRGFEPPTYGTGIRKTPKIPFDQKNILDLPGYS